MSKLTKKQIKERIRVDGSTISADEIPEEPEAIEDKADLEERLPDEANTETEPEQLELSLLPDNPPEPTFEGYLPVKEILEELVPYNQGRPPEAKFLRSVKRWGVREPIEINILPNKKLRLVSGRRRLKAAELLGLPNIKVRMYELDALVESTLSIDSNAQRSDNPLSDFEAILDLMTKAKARGTIIDEKDISQATGMPIQTIRKRMKLADLPREILTAVGGKRIALGVATEIANLSTNQQNELVEILKENGKLTGKDVQSIKQVDRKKAIQDIPADVFNTPDAEIHKHDFEWDREIVEVDCSCGLTLGTTEILDALNQGNYDIPL